MTTATETSTAPRFRVSALLVFLILAFVLSWYPWVLALLRHTTSGLNPVGLLVAALIASALGVGWRGPARDSPRHRSCACALHAMDRGIPDPDRNRCDCSCARNGAGHRRQDAAAELERCSIDSSLDFCSSHSAKRPHGAASFCHFCSGGCILSSQR